MTWTIRRTLGDTCGAGRVTGRHAEDLPPVAGERTSGSWPGSLSRGMAAPALCVPGSRRRCRRAGVAWVVAQARSDRCPRPSPPQRALRTRVPRPAAPTGPRRALTRRTRARPARRHPVAGHPATEPDGRVPSTSLAHVAALVRAAVPPMHPGGRPIVAGVAAAAGLVRAPHRPRRPRRRSGDGRRRRLLPQPAPRAVVANGRRPLARRRHGRARLRGRAPTRAGPAPGAGTARQRLPVGPRRARPADPGRRAGRRRPVPARPLPVGGPRQGQRRQRAQRAAAGDRRRRPRRDRADRGPAGPADPLRRRPGRRGGGGGDLRTDPVRFAGRHLPAGGLDGHRRGRAAHDRRRDGACATPGRARHPRVA